LLAFIVELVVIPFLLALLLLKKNWWLTFAASIFIPAVVIFIAIEYSIATHGSGGDAPFYTVLYALYVPGFCFMSIFMRWLIFFLELHTLGKEEVSNRAE